MCGIAGFVKLNRCTASAADLERMIDAIRHRGPDGHGIYDSGAAFLGHRRLSIIDVAGGHQPMSNETGSVWITYNGEVFNHSSIRPKLEQAGHRYVTRCDTETIVHAYEEYGHDCVTHFRGMFAFAIWDAERQTLFCARDRLGIKPLYYFSNSRVFAFASEIKALLRHPEIETALEQEESQQGQDINGQNNSAQRSEEAKRKDNSRNDERGTSARRRFVLGKDQSAVQ